MNEKLVIIGIDSLDPYVILEHRDELPTFSQLIKESSTFLSKSVFPVDTIPAWVSIYTGFHPGNHGVLYVYDVFDPNLSDLRKLDISHIKGKTFWDYASEAGYKVAVLYPTLMFPTWKVNGVMISKSPYDRRVNDIQTSRDISCYPEKIKEKYGIPTEVKDIWGGYPGKDKLAEWASLGKDAVLEDFNMAFRIYKGEKWDMFFVYFSHLDIIQHRLWRFFDRKDPMYRYDQKLTPIILDFYKLFDNIIGKFINELPDAQFIVLSDHGHQSRPIKTLNINEYLRQNKLLKAKKVNILGIFRKIMLNIITTLNLEKHAIRIISRSHYLTKYSKQAYSSSGLILKEESKAWLSTFAGIKSYPHGGIEINSEIVSKKEYDELVSEIIKLLYTLRGPNGEQLVKWARRREDVYNGKYTEQIFPDILFELKDDWGVGWELGRLYGKSHDHKVASGGHRKDAVLLLRNIRRDVVRKNDISIVDMAPSILDLMNVDTSSLKLDGKSIFR
ncbi:alkaline phosphatase family protein [Thermococcus pacificus]|uniref:Phosphodiesterase n=1 Tax=Thermococcus pacificus TaxID=71998 RepID=A0A218P6J0_9EURY|nr:alkaline phosphatase family protein [Thermococcus pacificus]ASJ06387.1 hypothetical protein A3L08_03085 [Thermococcus pacificus]